MELPLEGARRKLALLLVSAGVAALISFQAARLWLADARVYSNLPERIKIGAALEPGNAEAWVRLGRLQQWDLMNPNPALAVTDFERAVHDNPLSAHNWMDLAGAYEDAGNIPQARNAFERAKSVYPASAEVAWLYGNFLLRRGELDAGFVQIQRAVKADPSLLPVVISRTWRSSHDVQMLLDRVLPPDVDAYFDALNFLASEHQADAAAVVWQRLLALGKPVALSRSFPYLDELIRAQRSQEARRVWLEGLAAAGMPHDEPANHSLVWDGDFSREFAHGGLGWRWDSPPGIVIDFDLGVPGRRGRSVRLDFGGGTNADLDQPYQLVPVEPARTYHFHAFLRTQGITTDSGMRLSVWDPYHPGTAQLLSDSLTGSHQWTAVDAEVDTGPETHFLRISLRRVPSRLFDNRLAGVAWLADVSLIPANAPGQPSR